MKGGVYISILDHGAHVILGCLGTVRAGALPSRSQTASIFWTSDSTHQKGQPTCHKVQGYPQPSLLHEIA